jgi:hypothetical protein
MPTTTTQNVRLFAPHVVLTQDTTRLGIKLKSGEGYTIPSGLTLGDVIRYDPTAVGYTLSRANSEQNAEVLGVVETISGGEYFVVCSGSVKYPAARLSAIGSGAAGGIDVLFLDENVAGGLTGTIDLSTGQEKIVKPVIQVAPHAGYNGVVMNYVGYKTGTQAVSQEDAPLLPVGSIMYSLPTVTPGVNWLRIDNDIQVNAADYSELYVLYGTANGPWIEKMVVNAAEPVQAGWVGLTVFTPTGVEHGQITQVDVVNNILYVTVGTGQGVYTEATAQINQTLYTITSSSVYAFTIPVVSSGAAPTQGSVTLVPFIKAYESVSVKIPEVITLTGLTASNNIYVGGNATVVGTLSVGSFTNIAAEISALKSAVGL